MTEREKEQNSNIIIAGLGNHALRVDRSVIEQPSDMMKKLDARYNTKSTATRISKMAELVSIKYQSVREDIAKHVDRMGELLE